MTEHLIARMSIDLGKLEQWLQENKTHPLALRYRGCQIQEKETELVLNLLNRYQEAGNNTIKLLENLYAECPHEMESHPVDFEPTCRFCLWSESRGWSKALEQWVSLAQESKGILLNGAYSSTLNSIKKRVIDEIAEIIQKGESHGTEKINHPGLAGQVGSPVGGDESDSGVYSQPSDQPGDHVGAGHGELAPVSSAQGGSETGSYPTSDYSGGGGC